MQSQETTVERVRDRLWLWAHEAGSHNTGWEIPTPSRMTPTEGACYLQIPNLMMIRYEGKPEMPFDIHLMPMRVLKRVVWSITGAGGATSDAERKHVLELATRFPNITGVVMDDFFSSADGNAALSVEQLAHIRQEMQGVDRPLDVFVVLYKHQLGWALEPHLNLCDQAIFWTWEAHELERLEEHFITFENVACNCRKLLGCYMWDYGTRQPMPLPLMQKQCEMGLEWLQEGRIQGMVFLASCICDLGLEAVEWTRHWIAEVGEQVWSGGSSPH